MRLSREGWGVMLLATILVFIFFSMLLFGSTPPDKTTANEVKATGATDIQHAVTANRLRTYFNRNPKYASKCNAYKEKVERREEGFQLTKYKKYPISHVSQQQEYSKTIYRTNEELYEMKASIRCIYKVTVQVSVFSYGEERVELDGGKVYFKLGLYENAGGYHVNRMEAYKHSRN